MFSNSKVKFKSKIVELLQKIVDKTLVKQLIYVYSLTRIRRIKLYYSGRCIPFELFAKEKKLLANEKKNERKF